MHMSKEPNPDDCKSKDRQASNDAKPKEPSDLED
jgi:hypothetical protein